MIFVGQQCLWGWLEDVYIQHGDVVIVMLDGGEKSTK